MAQLGRVVYRDAALIDTSAVIALFDQGERFHAEAKTCFSGAGLSWAALNVTSHEAFTRIRYRDSLQSALQHYRFLRQSPVQMIPFEPGDEDQAEQLLLKYHDHRISFHDALCAAVMLRAGMYRIFTFDRDFHILGFEVLPGIT